MFIEKLRNTYSEAVDKEKKEALSAFFKDQARIILKSALDESFAAAKAKKKSASIFFVAHPNVVTHVVNMLSAEGIVASVVREFKNAAGNLAVTIVLSGWVDSTAVNKDIEPPVRCQILRESRSLG